MLGKKFQQQHFEILVLLFLEEKVRHFMWIVSNGDNLLEMLNPVFWEI